MYRRLKACGAARPETGKEVRCPAASPCRGRSGSAWPLLLVLLAFASSVLVAQYQKAPPGGEASPKRRRREGGGLDMVRLALAGDWR